MSSQATNVDSLFSVKGTVVVISGGGSGLGVSSTFSNIGNNKIYFHFTKQWNLDYRLAWHLLSRSVTTSSTMIA